MKRHVRLGVVLRLREMEEEAARARLAAALDAHRSAVRSCDRATERLAEQAAALAEVQRGDGRADRLIDAARAMALAETRRAAAASAVESAAGVLMEQRDRLAEADRRREVVERLRDRIIAEERLADDRREQAAASDRATTRHAWLAVMEADR